MRSAVIEAVLTVQLLHLHIKRNQLRWFRNLTRMSPRHFLHEVFWACLGGPGQDMLEKLHLASGFGMSQCFPMKPSTTVVLSNKSCFWKLPDKMKVS